MLDKLFPEDEIRILNSKGKVIHTLPENTSGWRPVLLGRLLALSERYPEYHPEKLYWTTASEASEGLPPMPLLGR